MTISFFTDRYPKAELAKKRPDVALSLKKSAATMMENSQALVAWVGVAKADTQDAVVFLPHGAPAESGAREQFTKSLMRAIVRFAREHSRTGEDRGSESATQAALLAELASDYRDYGLYETREKIRSRHDGKPDWARTVKTEIAFPANSGAPIYSDIVTARFSSFATNIVARVQAAVIDEIAANHGWWLAHYFGARELPRSEPLTQWPRKIWPNMLRLARRDLFQARAVRLVSMLLEYLEGAMETGGGPVVCGVSDFSTIWETMLRETLSGVEPHWNSYLPGPVYLRPDGTGSTAGRMQLDIVVRHNDRLFILDAKYYRATSQAYVPSLSDISKQIMYQKAVESTGVVPANLIANAFLFPAEETQREPYKSIGFFLPDGSPARGFSSVECQYVSMAEVVSAYASRRKVVDQSWLPALSSVPAVAS